MPSPLTEDDLIALANKFQQWKEYLTTSSCSSSFSSVTEEYPSFPKLFNCISSIHESFFNTRFLQQDHTSLSPSTPQQIDINNNNNSNYNYNNSKNNNHNQVRKGNKRRYRNDPGSVGESIIPYHRNKEEEEEEEEKTISDIPNEVLATILEYIFFHLRQTGLRELIELSLVSKLWCRMTRLVSSSSGSRYLSLSIPILSIHIYLSHSNIHRVLMFSLSSTYHQ